MTPRKRSRPYARIAITLPPDILGAADRLARKLDRSRSWVVAEAVRQYASAALHGPTDTIAAARDAQLQRELALSPAERLQRAEELLQLARLAHPRKPRTQVIAFDSADEFAEWKSMARIRA